VLHGLTYFRLKLDLKRYDRTDFLMGMAPLEDYKFGIYDFK
jgi:hypothetical protein